jgi:shikimate dehydrogenase
MGWIVRQAHRLKRVCGAAMRGAAETRRYNGVMYIVLLGNPLEHSVSPAMQNAGLAAAGLNDWQYTAKPVPRERLGVSVLALREPDCAGANVTVPFKTDVIEMLDGLTPVAHAIGAVNTIVKHDGRLIGHNTDAAGFLADLHAHGLQARLRPALVLGAGGAARAVVAALAGVGAQVRVVARRPSQAENLSHVAPLEIHEWSSAGLQRASRDCGLIVNATPLGTAPDAGSTPWPEDVPLPDGAFVYDLVYNPRETRLTRFARTCGLRAATGLGMLVEQGALAFELWTGLAAPRANMRRAAEAGLQYTASYLN